MCSDSSLLLVRKSASTASSRSALYATFRLVAPASCRQWRERPAHALGCPTLLAQQEGGVVLRSLLLTFICTVVLITVACGGKKPVTRTIPPPPPPAERPTTAK